MYIIIAVFLALFACSAAQADSVEIDFDTSKFDKRLSEIEMEIKVMETRLVIQQALIDELSASSKKVQHGKKR